MNDPTSSNSIEKTPIKNTFLSSLIIFLLLLSLLAFKEFFNISLFSITSLSILASALFFLIFSLYSDKGIEQFEMVKKLLKLWKN